VKLSHNKRTSGLLEKLQPKMKQDKKNAGARMHTKKNYSENWSL
jgi:hypothetical protein